MVAMIYRPFDGWVTRRNRQTTLAFTLGAFVTPEAIRAARARLLVSRTLER